MTTPAAPTHDISPLEDHMHTYFTLLAIDLANERSREAQERYERRRLMSGTSESVGIRRRLTDAARGVLSMFDGVAPIERRTQPRLPAGHTH
jgi:hypothetical protein